MKQKVRTILSGQIPVAVIFMILGLCLIFVPAATFNVISKVVFGLALILSGLYHVATYCFPKKGTESSALDLYPGVISLVLGIQPSYVTKAREQMLKQFFNIDGTAKDFDRKLKSL
jgi:uncharacterized membrane protein HdeD (DUF308 family)